MEGIEYTSPMQLFGHACQDVAILGFEHCIPGSFVSVALGIPEGARNFLTRASGSHSHIYHCKFRYQTISKTKSRIDASDFLQFL